MKYKLKNENELIVEAMQFKRSEYNELNSFCNNKLNKLTIERRLNGKAYCYLYIDNGKSVVSINENDYIIKLNEEDYLVMNEKLFNDRYITNDRIL